MRNFFRHRIYMDYAAAAPMLSEARVAARAAERFFGNPSSIHRDGVRAARVLDETRGTIAEILHGHPDEIVFTATGTESDNLALLGVFNQARESVAFEKPHIITLETEHPAVLESFEHLRTSGAEVTYLPVGADGRVDPKAVRAALRPETLIVSVMYANNEIGTIQPIREIAKEIRHFKKETESIYPLFHTDACQAAPHLSLNIAQLGVDLLSFSGIKLGAGHGAAVLYVRRGTPIMPILFGGGQEHGLRPGTENLPAIAALAAALGEVEKIKTSESARLGALRDYFFEEVKKRMPDARINGAREDRLPNNVHISFPGITSELLVLELDGRGIRASAGSACSASEDSESPVLAALYGVGDGKKWGSIRFSLGRETSRGDVMRALSALENIKNKYILWQKGS